MINLFYCRFIILILTFRYICIIWLVDRWLSSIPLKISSNYFFSNAHSSLLVTRRENKSYHPPVEDEMKVARVHMCGLKYTQGCGDEDKRRPSTKVNCKTRWVKTHNCALYNLSYNVEVHSCRFTLWRYIDYQREGSHIVLQCHLEGN